MLVDYSRYHMQIKPYIDQFGIENVLLIPFEQLRSEPQQILNDVCRFIGYGNSPVWVDKEAQNVSSQRIRKFPLYGLFVDNRISCL